MPKQPDHNRKVVKGIQRKRKTEKFGLVENLLPWTKLSCQPSNPVW
jgi:hypothetical protein